MNKLLLTDSELKDIVLRYGSPLYLFYENEFRANFAHLCEAFRAVYKIIFLPILIKPIIHLMYVA